MEKKLKEQLSALDPRFRKKIEELFTAMNESVSMLYEAAIHDEKTGLYNNKFFETMFEMEAEKAKRKQQKLSMIMMDIDFFKKINDTYGHVKADDLLDRLATVIRKQIRKSDIFARFGGEEFVILLPETNLEKAKKFASRLKSAIHGDSMLRKHHLTVSGGISQYKREENRKTLKERVDKALYQAKESGRDKFIVLK